MHASPDPRFALYPIIDVSEWEADPTVMATGQRRKEWLIHPHTRQHALLKMPHYHPAESAAEKVACEIGNIVGIPTAETHLAIRHGEYGIISYKFVRTNEPLIDGGDLIVARHPRFDRRRTRIHSFQLVRNVLPASLLPAFIELLVLDAVIGNSDRHHDNWSVLLLPNSQFRLAPSYDHGSSLGRDIPEDTIVAGMDPALLESYVRKASSRVGWEEKESLRRMRHLDLLRRIRSEHPRELDGCLQRVLAADVSQLTDVAGLLPESYATPPRRALMADLIRSRIRLLREAFSD